MRLIILYGDIRKPEFQTCTGQDEKHENANQNQASKLMNFSKAANFCQRLWEIDK